MYPFLQINLQRFFKNSFVGLLKQPEMIRNQQPVTIEGIKKVTIKPIRVKNEKGWDLVADIYLIYFETFFRKLFKFSLQS